MIGKWRYGIIKFRHSHNENNRFYGIGELYYKDDPNKIYYCSSEPVEPYADFEEGESPKEELIKSLQRMMNDLNKFPEPFDVDGPFEKEEESDWLEWTEGEDENTLKEWKTEEW